VTILEACLAKPYRWLGLLHSRLVHVGKGTRVNCLKLVAFLLAFPVFEARYFLFQLLYALQERRLRLSGFYELHPGINDSIQEFGSFLPNLGRGVERLNTLRDVRSSFKAAQSGSDFSNSNHDLLH
jgi:hypothetical protein